MPDRHARSPTTRWCRSPRWCAASPRWPSWRSHSSPPWRPTTTSAPLPRWPGRAGGPGFCRSRSMASSLPPPCPCSCAAGPACRPAGARLDLSAGRHRCQPRRQRRRRRAHPGRPSRRRLAPRRPPPRMGIAHASPSPGRGRPSTMKPTAVSLHSQLISLENRARLRGMRQPAPPLLPVFRSRASEIPRPVLAHPDRSWTLEELADRVQRATRRSPPRSEGSNRRIWSRPAVWGAPSS